MAIYIKDIRKKRGIKQKDLADTLGVQPNYIARLESGERALTNEWVIKLTKALNCEPWELCDDVDYFFSRDNLHKIFKNSINFTGDNYGNFAGDNYGSQAITTDHSKTSPPDNDDKYKKELIDVFDQLTVRKQHDLLGYAYNLLEEKDQEN